MVFNPHTLIFCLDGHLGAKMGLHTLIIANDWFLLEHLLIGLVYSWRLSFIYSLSSWNFFSILDCEYLAANVFVPA